MPVVEVCGKLACETALRPHSATNLVVDDDRDVRELAVSSLENLGYQVLAAEGDRLATSRSG